MYGYLETQIIPVFDSYYKYEKGIYNQISKWKTAKAHMWKK